MREAAIKARKAKFPLLVCLTISMGLLLAGLWPFDFYPKNNVQWIVEDNGLRFDRYGIAFIKRLVFSSTEGVDLSKPFTILMKVRPRDDPADSLPRILSVYEDDGREILFIGQWKTELILRIYEDDRSNPARHRETGVNKLHRDEKRTVAICSDEKRMSIYVDGTIAIDKPGFNAPLHLEFPGPARIALGNSPSGKNPWRGELYALSIYPKALSPEEIRSPIANELIGNDIVIPAVFRAPKKQVLLPPWEIEKINRSFWWDEIVNILGFIPFGMAICQWLRKDDGRQRRSTVIIAVMLGAVISLLIELLQVYLPSRDSSLTDVTNNIIGTYIGTFLYPKAHRILYS